MVQTVPRDEAQRNAEAVPSAPAEVPIDPPTGQPTVTAEADDGTLAGAARAAAGCRACHLWEPATQTVFGEGTVNARVLVVGEQPGDQEDLAGRPFVGPAGRMFDSALADLGIPRSELYVTNAVKHFKFEPRGKRRIHSKPNQMEIKACVPWLEREMALVGPEIVVMLGATAARAVMGYSGAITRLRGRWLDLPNGRRGLATVHPSFLLRLPDEAAKRENYAQFVADLRLLAEALGVAAR